MTEKTSHHATRLLIALVAASFALLASADAALAQSGGAGDLLGFLDQLVQIATRAIGSIFTLAFIAAAIAWVASGTNDRRKEKATAWMMGTGLVAIIAFGAPVIVGFLQSIAPGGGGG